MKILKKTLAMLLSIVMVFGIMPASVFMASAEEASACPIEGATGTGTEEDPIIVDTFSELKNALEYAGDVYVEVTKDITCTETIFIPNNGKKTLLIDNTLTSNEVIFNCCDGAKFVLKGNGKFVSKEACLYLNDSDTSVWTEGDLIFESEASPVLSSSGRLYVNGGTFTSANSASIYPVNGNSYGSLYVYVTRGAFPKGVASLCGSIKTNSANSIAFNKDGERLAAPVTNCPIWVYNFNLATREDNEDDLAPDWTVSSRGFGRYAVGDPLGEKTIGFTTYKLPQMAIDAGFTIKENLKITSTNRGVILDQNSGQSYTTDVSIADHYSFKISVAIVDPNGEEIVKGSIKYSLDIVENAKNITGTIYDVTNTDKIKISLYRYEDGALYAETTMNDDCTYLLTAIEPGKYTIEVTNPDYYKSTAVVTVADKIVTQDFHLISNYLFSVSGRISGVPEGRPITINLYKAGEDTPFKTTTAYGQGDFDIDNLPLNVAFTINNIPNGDYILEAECDNYVTYRYSFTIKDQSFTDLIFMESYKTVVVDITGMYDTDTATVKLYEKGTDTVVHTATIRGNGSHIFAEVAKGDYTVEVSAIGYKTKTSNLYIYNSDSVKSVYFDMELDSSGIDFGFATQSPEPTADEITDGQTDLGLMSTLPTFSFTAKQLYFKYMDMGYTIKTRTQVEYSSGATETFDSTTWTCGNYYDGTNKVTQIVMLIDPDGNEVGRKTHTYTFTYAKLYFESRTPGVTNEQAAAGFSDLGTLTTAPKFAFSAYPLSSALTKEGYSQTVKMEAYQGDKLVYSADNGNTYIHIYPGEGTVFQTIYLLNADGEVVDSISHAYTFTVEFPEGTIALDADFLTLAENSTHQLSATFAPESLADTLVWTSSNSAVATIDSNGNITAVRAGSVLITATLGNGATAYCTVLVTAEDVKAYVGGIGLAEGEYLAQGSSIPTTVKPADNYAYLATVNGKLTLTLHNYSYSGMGTFTSKNAAYGIYSTQELKVIAEGTNKIGPMSAPVERYTSYGIGKGDTVSITSDASSVLNITGVSTAISSSRYVMVSGNINITDATSGISCTHAQAMGGINFQSGNVNINCTGTAITVTGNYVAFTGADVTINCKGGINLVRQGEITIDDGSLKMYASASGINVKSGQAMTVNGGTAYIEAVNNAVALEGALNVNGGSIVLISTDTASDSSYSAISGAGTLTLASGISSVASTSSNYSTSSLYADSRRSTLDYVSFRGGSNYEFVKQPVGGDAKASGTMTIAWETGFKPTKLELITFDGTSSTVSTLNSYLNYADFGVLPEGGYYQLRAYYATNYSITSDKFYVYSTAHTVTFCLGDSPVVTQDVADGECAHPIAEPGMEYKFFYGWLTEDGKVFDFSTPITEDITLTAGWADVMVDGVAMPNGSYRGKYSTTATTGRPSGSYAHYKDGVLTLYNYNNSSGSGIAFGEIDLTVVSTGEGNAVSCIVSDYDYAKLTIDGTAQLNVGHSQWMYSAIQVYDTITFKCDTVVECIDAMAIPDVLTVIVDDCDVSVYAYADMGNPRTIYGCEAPITVLSGSLYLYCEGDATNTDSYIANPDKVLVYASDSVDGDLTDDKITNRGDEPYELDLYRQIKITSYNTVKFHVDGYAVLMQKVPTGMCIEKPLDSDYGNRVFLGWCTEDGSLYDFNTPVTEELNLYAKFAVVEPVHGDFDFENNIISGILPGTTSLDYYGTFTNPDYAWSYQTDNGYLGTGTVANVVNGDEIIESYSILLYGDVNGDGWCDGMDAVLVSCIVNGMLSESDISELAYRAADCNHDGVIDEADVDLLNQAGALLAEVDQTKSAEVLLETSSAYVEYISLIDQTPEIDVEDETDAPESDVEPEDTTPEQNAKIDIFEMIISFIKSIFEMLLAFIPVPIK